MPTITVNHVSKYYFAEKKKLFRKRGRYEVGLNDVNISVKQGEFVFIIGSSGSGKSTLMKLISGQMAPDYGSVEINGKDLSKLKKRSLQRLPLLVGYVAQQNVLNSRMVIEENLRQSAKIGCRIFGDQPPCEDRIRKVLGLTGLSGVEKKYPGELMAGERRRAELARALINSPPVLVLDEVTANLDADSMWDVYLLLHEINRLGTTVIMSTHNSNYVNMLRRRVITLVDGHVYSDNIKGRYGEVRKRAYSRSGMIL